MLQRKTFGRKAFFKDKITILFKTYTTENHSKPARVINVY